MTLAELGLRLGAAVLLGALIGIDRELKNRPAGLRTHILTALAAALFTIIAFEIQNELRVAHPDAQVDALRAIEAVTAGVAFLATGGIIVSRGQVMGLTTGAAMWLAGAVGVACGAGFFRIAIIATGVALVVLAGSMVFEHRQAPKAIDAKTADDTGVGATGS